MDLAEYRQPSAATPGSGWRPAGIAAASGCGTSSRPVGEGLVAMLEPEPGQTMLELAAGTGETGFAAAARVGDDGKLISSDFSAFEMIEAARRRAAAARAPQRRVPRDGRASGWTWTTTPSTGSCAAGATC